MVRRRSRAPRFAAIASAVIFGIALVVAPDVFACAVKSVVASCVQGSNVAQASVTVQWSPDGAGYPSDTTVDVVLYYSTNNGASFTKDTEAAGGAAVSSWSPAAPGKYTYTYSHDNNTYSNSSSPLTLTFPTDVGTITNFYVYAYSGGDIASKTSSHMVGNCAPTASLVAHLSISAVGAAHTVRWTSAEHVLGFNVFTGKTQLNRKPVTSKTDRYSFTTSHSLHALRIEPIGARG